MTVPEAGQGGRAPDSVRDRLVLPLDVDDLVSASRLVRQVGDYFGVVKVGLELYSAAGPDAITTFVDQGFTVFADLKLCDIPTTVNHAARVMGALGAGYLTVHAFGGADMVRAGVEGFDEGASAVGSTESKVLAVTVLTSDGTAPQHILGQRVKVALAAGAGGIVCAGTDVTEARQYGPRLTIAVPGIRPHGSAADDQARRVTPSQAVRAGADLLVVGRPVTAAADPVAAAARLAAEVEAAT
ncbi:MAG TPA: orotidine-5'-phosphate decarboxylase [Acidimicrobiales bacterium]|nr:orotidine-5'-phosphate decarboxylase [Acidimicrobiales bacterium]